MNQAIPSTNEIATYLHCGKCMDEMPESGISPRNYASLEVGFTLLGIQIWCKRHEINVMHMSFEGAKHPANLSISREV